jgi:transcriptional regulator with XRE-family HTH domain
MGELPLLLTQAQAATLLGVSPSTLSAWVRAGVMPDRLPGTNRWSRTQIENAAAGRPWIAEPVTRSAEQEYDAWERRESHREAKRKPHSYGNLDFDPGGPIGKREASALIAMHGLNYPLKEEDIPGIGTATIEKLGLRGYIVASGYFYKLLLTDAGRVAAARVVEGGSGVAFNDGP